MPLFRTQSNWYNYELMDCTCIHIWPCKLPCFSDNLTKIMQDLIGCHCWLRLSLKLKIKIYGKTSKLKVWCLEECKNTNNKLKMENKNMLEFVWNTIVFWEPFILYLSLRSMFSSFVFRSSTSLLLLGAWREEWSPWNPFCTKFFVEH